MSTRSPVLGLLQNLEDAVPALAAMTRHVGQTQHSRDREQWLECLRQIQSAVSSMQEIASHWSALCLPPVAKEECDGCGLETEGGRHASADLGHSGSERP